MNPLDLTVNQLRRAAAIKEQIEALNKELRSILGVSAKSRPGRVKLVAKAKKKTMSAAARAKLSAKLKAYWAAKKAGKQ